MAGGEVVMAVVVVAVVESATDSQIGPSLIWRRIQLLRLFIYVGLELPISRPIATPGNRNGQ